MEHLNFIYYQIKHSLSLWKASRNNPGPTFSNCMKRDVTTVLFWLTSFRKKTIVYYCILLRTNAGVVCQCLVFLNESLIFFIVLFNIIKHFLIQPWWLSGPRHDITNLFNNQGVIVQWIKWSLMIVYSLHFDGPWLDST